MFKLVLTFFMINASLVVQAQETLSDTISWYGSDGSLTTGLTDLTDLTWPQYSWAIVELLELYKEYEAECWNDSSFVGYWDFAWVGDSTWVTETWVHKEPKFGGFMQYLKEQ